MNVSTPMKNCIEACWAARNECQKTLFEHCLVEGGDHAEAGHVRLMIDCMEICQTAADLMVRGSPLHTSVCAACAEICESCAGSCEALKDAHMKKCAESCRACAEQCYAMSEQKAAA